MNRYVDDACDALGWGPVGPDERVPSTVDRVANLKDPTPVLRVSIPSECPRILFRALRVARREFV